MTEYQISKVSKLDFPVDPVEDANHLHMHLRKNFLSLFLVLNFFLCVHGFSELNIVNYAIRAWSLSTFGMCVCVCVWLTVNVFFMKVPPGAWSSSGLTCLFSTVNNTHTVFLSHELQARFHYSKACDYLTNGIKESGSSIPCNNTEFHSRL